MQSQKLLTSISTIPNESKYFQNSNQILSPLSGSYSSSFMQLPISTTLPLKFPKKLIRKQTNQNMLTETKYNQSQYICNPEKSTVRVFEHANRSRVFEDKDDKKRLAKAGLFKSLERQTVQTLPLNRSIEDIGAPQNRKKFSQARHLRPDPITIGQSHHQHNSALERVWGEPRRHRDNGKQCQQTLAWKTDKTKGYFQRYNLNKNKYTKSSKYIANKMSIL